MGLRCSLCSVWVCLVVILVSLCSRSKAYWTYSLDTNDTVNDIVNDVAHLRFDSAGLENTSILLMKTNFSNVPYYYRLKISTATPVEHISVVVQNMSLPLPDYVDIYAITTDTSVYQNKTFYGSLSTANMNKNNTNETINDSVDLPNAFDFLSDEINVVINITSNSSQERGFAILFTAVADCSFSKEYKPCGNTTICIHRSLFNDSLVNCPVESCPDEQSCVPVKKAGFPFSPHQTILIVILTVGLAVLFLALWLCWNFNLLCWGQKARQPIRYQQRRGNRRRPEDQTEAGRPMVEMNRSVYKDRSPES